ncbi:hypothetical protein C5167_009967 [Papaver somniferum]|uniref:Uncharacterized protein n=1 Tax=Papaver somniferum TaxID=3469 RepID=A0A4Y7K016_PAPSO|nr:hypothetical protein C5167_009967 [Papaver somniferum]
MFSRRNLRSLPLIAGAVVPTFETNMPLGQFKTLAIPNLNLVVKSPNSRLGEKITKDRPRAYFQSSGRVKSCAAYQTREGEMVTKRRKKSSSGYSRQNQENGRGKINLQMEEYQNGME